MKKSLPRKERFYELLARAVRKGEKVGRGTKGKKKSGGYNGNMKYKNTLKRGVVRYIIFKEDKTWYGVALEFNIVEEGDNPLEVMASLFQAIQGYVETARKLKMRPIPLNQKPDKEYQKVWNKLEKREIERL